MTLACPRSVLVKVQVTVCPALTVMPAAGSLPLSQVALVRSQPAAADSVTLYPGPGASGLLALEPPPVSLKLGP